MKEIPDIVMRLTVTCIVAAAVMGGVFMLTSEAKLHNEHIAEQGVMLGLLGYNNQNPAPESMKIFNLYRYILTQGDSKFIGYIVPVQEGSATEYRMLVIDLDGKFAALHPLSVTPEKIADRGERDKALAADLPGNLSFFFADAAIVVNNGDQRQAYLLPGAFPGFKALIKVFLALDPQLTVLGYDVVEHEEDPGLGDGIEMAFFKNQFRDRTVEAMKAVKVVKIPLPDEYRSYLEQEIRDLEMLDAEQKAIKEKYKDSDIHALTGATISSEAVANGLKAMLRKFSYRLLVLENVIDEQSIPVAF